MINSKTKPLAAYLFTNDSQLKQQFERNISAGGMIFNDTGIHVRQHSYLLTKNISCTKSVPELSKTASATTILADD